jgi:hypothetical protein
MTRMHPMTPDRRLRWTALMFLIALIFLAIASLTHDVWPLFVGWIPLLAVPWILTRPEAIPGETGSPSALDGTGDAHRAEGRATSPTQGEPPSSDRPPQQGRA